MSLLRGDYEDLLEQKGYAALATNSPSGHPQVTYVAYLFDADGELKLSLNQTRQKTKNLLKDPRCTLFIVDANNPYRTIEVRANAEILDDADFEFARRAGSKYGADFRANDQPGESRVVVVLHPVKVNARG